MVERLQRIELSLNEPVQLLCTEVRRPIARDCVELGKGSVSRDASHLGVDDGFEHVIRDVISVRALHTECRKRDLCSTRHEILVVEHA